MRALFLRRPFELAFWGAGAGAFLSITARLLGRVALPPFSLIALGAGVAVLAWFLVLALVLVASPLILRRGSRSL